MSVIVYIESEENKIKIASLEAVSYAKKISESLKKDLIAVSFNLTDFSILNNHGVDKLYNIFFWEIHGGGVGQPRRLYNYYRFIPYFYSIK